jgi:hypothetical protein
MAKETKKPSTADWLDIEDAPLEHPVKESTWRDMGDLVGSAPGRLPPGHMVVLLPEAGATGEVCIWRVSRQFVAGPGGRGGRFESTGFWSLRNSGGQRIGWEPVGWRPYQEPAYEPKRAS